MKTIWICGDSVLKGVQYENGRYGLYEGRHYEPLARLGYKINNLSKMGATVEKGLALAPFGEPGDLALCEYGGNDCDFNWDEVSASPAGSFLPHTAPGVFTARYREFIAGLKERGLSVIVSGLIPLDAHRYLDFISSGRSRDNILSWLGDESMLSRWQESYHAAVRDLAHETDCPFADIRAPFLLRHDFPALLGDDGIHPTADGHALIQSTLADFFKTL